MLDTTGWEKWSASLGFWDKNRLPYPNQKTRPSDSQQQQQKKRKPAE